LSPARSAAARSVAAMVCLHGTRVRRRGAGPRLRRGGRARLLPHGHRQADRRHRLGPQTPPARPVQRAGRRPGADGVRRDRRAVPRADSAGGGRQAAGARTRNGYGARRARRCRRTDAPRPATAARSPATPSPACGSVSHPVGLTRRRLAGRAGRTADDALGQAQGNRLMVVRSVGHLPTVGVNQAAITGRSEVGLGWRQSNHYGE